MCLYSILQKTTSISFFNRNQKERLNRSCGIFRGKSFRLFRAPWLLPFFHSSESYPQKVLGLKLRVSCFKFRDLESGIWVSGLYCHLKNYPHSWKIFPLNNNIINIETFIFFTFSILIRSSNRRIRILTRSSNGRIRILIHSLEQTN